MFPKKHFRPTFISLLSKSKLFSLNIFFFFESQISI